MQDQAAALEKAHWQQSRLRLEGAVADPVLRRQAHRMLWEICQFLGDRDAAVAHLRAAIDEDPLFTRPQATPRPHARSVLVLAVPGDFQANLPLDRLFDDSTLLHTLWLADPDAILRDPAAAIPSRLPRIDAIFIAVAQDAGHGTALRAADALAAAIGLPTINHGERINRLSRAGTALLLHGLPGAIVPGHHEVGHGDILPIAFPVIIRPLGSHAGQKLQRLATADELGAYYAAHTTIPRFTVAPFVDYRSEDGLWRKYRVIFVDGAAYPLHLAIHDDWAIWYYNARMQDCTIKQAEERRFLADLRTAVPPPALLALRQLAQRVGLDYFGLDCGIMPDGRLLVFEVETGMIVHDRTPDHAAPAHPDPSLRIRHAVERLIEHRRIASHAA